MEIVSVGKLGFFDDKKNEIRKFDDPYETEYILFRSGVAFSRRMLINTDLQISIGVVSFESAAEYIIISGPVKNHCINDVLKITEFAP